MLAYLGQGAVDDVRAYDPVQNAWVALPGRRHDPDRAHRGRDRVEPGRPAAVPVRRAPYRAPPRHQRAVGLLARGRCLDPAGRDRHRPDRPRRPRRRLGPAGRAVAGVRRRLPERLRQLHRRGLVVQLPGSRLDGAGARPRPSARALHTAVWDEATRTARLFGGRQPVGSNTIELNDLWTYRATDFAATADLEVKSTHTGTFVRGQTGTYTLTVKNLGSAVATGPIQVHDTLPAGLTYVSPVGGGWDCSQVGQTVSCSRSGDLAAGVTPTITLTVTVENRGGECDQHGPGRQSNDRPNWGNNTGTDTTATIGPLSIGPATPLANGAVGTAYSQALQASGHRRTAGRSRPARCRAAAPPPDERHDHRYADDARHLQLHGPARRRRVPDAGRRHASFLDYDR